MSMYHSKDEETWAFPCGQGTVLDCVGSDRKVVEIGGRKFWVFNSFGLRDVGPEGTQRGSTGEETLKPSNGVIGSARHMQTSNAVALAASIVVASSKSAHWGQSKTVFNGALESVPRDCEPERRQLRRPHPLPCSSSKNARRGAKSDSVYDYKFGGAWLGNRSRPGAFVRVGCPDLGAEHDLHSGASQSQAAPSSGWMGGNAITSSAFRQISSSARKGSPSTPQSPCQSTLSRLHSDAPQSPLSEASYNHVPRHWHPTQARHAFELGDAPPASGEAGAVTGPHSAAAAIGQVSLTGRNAVAPETENAGGASPAQTAACSNVPVSASVSRAAESSFPSVGLRLTARVSLVEPHVGRRGLYPCGDSACQCMGHVYLHMGAAKYELELEIGLEEMNGFGVQVRERGGAGTSSSSSSSSSSAAISEPFHADALAACTGSKQAAIARFQRSRPRVDLFYNGLGAEPSRVLPLRSSCLPAWESVEATVGKGVWRVRFMPPQPTAGSLAQCRIRMGRDVLLTGGFDVRTKPAEWVLVHGGRSMAPAGAAGGKEAALESARRLVAEAALAQHRGAATAASRRAAGSVQVKDVVLAMPASSADTVTASAVEGPGSFKAAVSDVAAGDREQGPPVAGLRVFVRLGSRTQSNSVLQGFRLLRRQSADVTESKSKSKSKSKRHPPSRQSRGRARASRRKNATGTTSLAAPSSPADSAASAGADTGPAALVTLARPTARTQSIETSRLAHWLHVSFLCSLNKVKPDEAHLSLVPAPVDPLFAPVYAQVPADVLPEAGSDRNAEGKVSERSAGGYREPPMLGSAGAVPIGGKRPRPGSRSASTSGYSYGSDDGQALGKKRRRGSVRQDSASKLRGGREAEHDAQEVEREDGESDDGESSVDSGLSRHCEPVYAQPRLVSPAAGQEEARSSPVGAPHRCSLEGRSGQTMPSGTCWGLRLLGSTGDAGLGMVSPTAGADGSPAVLTASTSSALSPAMGPMEGSAGTLSVLEQGLMGRRELPMSSPVNGVGWQVDEGATGPSEDDPQRWEADSIAEALAGSASGEAGAGAGAGAGAAGLGGLSPSPRGGLGVVAGGYDAMQGFEPDRLDDAGRRGISECLSPVGDMLAGGGDASEAGLASRPMSRSTGCMSPGRGQSSPGAHSAFGPIHATGRTAATHHQHGGEAGGDRAGYDGWPSAVNGAWQCDLADGFTMSSPMDDWQGEDMDMDPGM